MKNIKLTKNVNSLKRLKNIHRLRTIKNLKKLKKETLLTTLFIIFIALLIFIVYDFFLNVEKRGLNFFLYYVPILFCQILPTIYMIKSRTIIIADDKKEIRTSFILLFYYILFLPIINFILGWNAIAIQRYFIIKLIGLINIGFLSYSISNIVKYVFIDVITKKRKITNNDLKYIFLSYIGIGITFGFVYYMITIVWGGSSFYGYTESENSLINYFQFIYFSFITLATVGYGDIHPVTFIGRSIVILEIIAGVTLVNLILAIVIGSGLFQNSDDNSSSNS